MAEARRTRRRTVRSGQLRIRVGGVPADDQAEELMGCSSAGLMCSIAAAHPDKYLTLPAESLQLPSEVVEFDMRGRMDAAKGGDYAYIDIGEVKSRLHQVCGAAWSSPRIAQVACPRLRRHSCA